MPINTCYLWFSQYYFEIMDYFVVATRNVMYSLIHISQENFSFSTKHLV